MLKSIATLLLLVCVMQQNLVSAQYRNHWHRVSESVKGVMGADYSHETHHHHRARHLDHMDELHEALGRHESGEDKLHDHEIDRIWNHIDRHQQRIDLIDKHMDFHNKYYEHYGEHLREENDVSAVAKKDIQRKCFFRLRTFNPLWY